MPRLPVRRVSSADLKELFAEMQLWTQIEDGTLTTLIISVRPATNPRYLGGASQILIHHDASNRHVCTTHRIVDADGLTVLHWDELDVKLATETVTKAHESITSSLGD
jgi:hypothetical protein